MKRNEYKSFKKAVELANCYDPIWYNAQLWLDLTGDQCDDMIKLLRVHPSIIKDGNKLRLPSGLFFTT